MAYVSDKTGDDVGQKFFIAEWFFTLRGDHTHTV
jgi:hypothetical protein